ncbi:sugar efflux transporter [Vibrio cincinnatiensis]|uniref:Predicted arabinose efflux permease, MFS family n=1 Tax=Vibrio cincinnatiensis DSM 19608 TaxID=1123491 RepID=A0A1T4NB61_VIBCI|nr:MFS transporter [Vibrio cincinnatiensis]SJZ76519.1 Predicted arabinose efflux permease, MFS family [Vibrio cincinnatiensis DSM 19608]SUP49128.1 sugar efflux transporter [Vibrio cincinnatiensis]
MSPLNHTNWRSWVAVFMLGIASFTVVATELAPIGMLSSIAQDMQQSASSTGLVVTLYAWLGAAAALISVMMISHLPRRPLLVGLMLLLGVSNGVAAVSHSFSVLLVARLVGALAHGAFWAMIGTLGAQLVSESSVGKATAIIFGGVSTASVLGVPLINWISSDAGWRSSFLLLAILSVVTALTLALSLPHVSGTPRLGRGQLFSVFRNSKLRIVYLIAACGIVSHFAAFTYVEVLFSSVIALPNSWISICLLTFGVAGIVGNIMCGMYIDNHLKRVLSTGLLLISLCLTLISLPTVNSKVMTLLLVSGWGLGVAILFVGLQTWIIRLAKDDALPASAIYAAIFNGALGMGAVLGAGILGHWNISTLYLSASLITLLSLALVVGSRKGATEKATMV